MEARSTQRRTSRSSPGRPHREEANPHQRLQSRSERPTPGQSSRTQPRRGHTCPPPSGSCSAPTPAAQKSSSPEAEAQRQKDGWRSQGHCPGRCMKAAEPMATGRREATADRKGMEAEGLGEDPEAAARSAEQEVALMEARSTQRRTSRSSPGRLHGEGAHHDLPPQSRSERPTPGQSSRTRASTVRRCPPPSGLCWPPTLEGQRDSLREG